MSDIQPYQFEPIYNPGEPIEGEESNGSDEETTDTNNRRSDTNVSWCLCGKCAVMEREKECLCCQEIEQIASHLVSGDVSCVTELEQFKTVCLDPTVLKTALVGMVDMGFQPVPADPIPNRYAWQFITVY